jgi:Zn-finger protein
MIELGDSTFFQNVGCEYYPCHGGVELDSFSCLFCYCPLYALDCPGNGARTAGGVKDCSGCVFPHHRSSYFRVIDCLASRFH